MGRDMLVEVLLGGELSLTLGTRGGRQVLAEVLGQAGRGEKLPVTLGAGEPLRVEVDLLVSLQSPRLVKHPPTLVTRQRSLLLPVLGDL